MRLARFCIQPGFFLMLAVGMLFVPFRWLAAFLTAAALHELFHLLFLKLFGFSVLRIELGPLGAIIETEQSDSIAMAICSLAGPASGLLLMLTVRIFPRIAICGLLQSMYNLLPVYPLDGGRALAMVLYHIFPEKLAGAVVSCLEKLAFLAITMLCIFCGIYFRMGLIVMLMPAALWWKHKKYSCNQNRLGVQ